MAAGFDGLAEVDEKGLNPDSPQAHAVFLEHVLKLDVSFLNGQDRDYFEAVLRVNRSRLAALQALPEDAGKDAVEEIRTQHAKELNVYKKQYGYEKVDDIVIQYLPVMQQKYMQQCVAAHPGSMRAILREFAKKLREESIMQH